MSNKSLIELHGGIAIRINGLKPTGDVPVATTMVADFKSLKEHSLISNKPLRRPNRTKPTKD